MINKRAILLSLLSFLLPTAVLAAEVNLYEQPQETSKVVGKVDLSVGIVPIYTPKTGDWMKVGDPRNGNTGWIKSDSFKSKTGVTSFSFKQMINEGSTPVTYQFIQSGGQQKLTEEQQKQMLKELQAHKLMMQQNLQKMFQEFDAMNHSWGSMPMVMPVVFVPVQVQPKAAQQPPAKGTDNTKNKN